MLGLAGIFIIINLHPVYLIDARVGKFAFSCVCKSTSGRRKVQSDCVLNEV